MSAATRPSKTPHQLRREQLRRKIAEIQAKRDARDAELVEQARREDEGKPAETLDEFEKRLGLT